MVRPRNRSDFRATDFRRSPLLVFYEVTQACGLVCTHCRACAKLEADPNELSTADSLRLIDQLSNFPDPPMLVLTGGDPLCRTDIYQLIEHATAAGLETSITPSATLLVTREAVRRLRYSGIHRMAISIDGANSETHDSVRGVTGSFARSLEILKDAQQLGLPTQVNTTLTPGNFSQIEELAKLIATFDIVLWSVFFLVPVGRAAFSGRLSAEQCEVAFERLWTQSHRQPYRIKTTEAPHYRRYSLQQERLSPSERKVPAPFRATGINDGKGVLFVGHTGEIYPSGFMPLCCGQFPQQDVVQVYQESPLLKDLRNPNRLEGKCRQCEYRTICGGSRARAYALTENPFAEEPDCAYIPAVLS
ncbi:radical SAM protein [Bythopirellula polymerisocia]|uniref:Antilisterial bacteriocin subtilosin biosynthesis protein AlbA n=1 Tax=Bythopirellula polymerisocia TaxID=2528003 RepID=A0A5C6CGB2_9BACT|nr:radical SAM protein [Bythopirellula polymerisocia]TWU21769.1 Antilisterial bacteriocin subtilosin biosynthesis protein AlbA [Bythopirellula polymerisocia]